MGSPISIGDAITIVGKVVDLYQKINDRPEEIRKVGEQMKGLKSFLSDLSMINLARLHSQNRFWHLVQDLHRDAKEVNDILKIWYDTGKYFQWMFSIGKNPGRLETLMDSIASSRTELGQIMLLQQSFASVTPTPSPSPVAYPTRTDYGVLFVDPNNLARSKVAEGYTKLLREWTTRTGGTWRIKFVHSAGIVVKNRCDCIDTLQALNMTIPLNDGGRPPHETAMASLYDNKFFNYPYKASIKKDMLASRSRGLTRTTFKTYDYVFVFVDREYSNLQRLKESVIQAHGNSIAPQGKGRIVHLGAYLSSTDRPFQLTDAPKNSDGSENIANWNATTKQIKLAIKNFLNKELGWTEPQKGGQQS